ncbi:16S rRNA (guanine(527)-N(7))-methyltransferase RsmG [Tetragenococcus koreensis]|uniref:16S rRNA (guanine(527)-N(7))-methyltransferase RsmG n=1 Tax=Tetragenococcus koreensis TaxID=290335 RepID=UPI001F24A7E1|nr:16S rRNA (guanine(527)-N(7))-methyltransferase RsmG [Tetragenococcus koreensis]MCF1618213.1 16S rRNA (guanine(527)-N(7))-methyltransferase RsmG [Tetragenococcus koreensis]MCF1619332.1 16S rRNA (guanine(527)-N(7))-methyltransferase RsmG [Tetragenococcus koreensis]MCF1622972.1 16S rRNA (guanine(527)-N(7))-methyltransferase RsmG [Tetragenococcus koreensis]MCF1626903.1 16S rRNA (guanine(527)-N(7))-methyltransferase RsmG [Tetragenococcus koreensis]MCF1656814.1 16S rRNA (guanine(527)-N(7))-methyl
MLPEEFQQKLREHHIVLTQTQIEQFERYYQLLVEWNQKINLTAITDKNEVYLKHFYDSVALAFSVDLDKKASICDIGSGAGFPSIPLKIIFPELKVTIVDSLNKRINFLRTLITELDLNQVALFHDRAETFGQKIDHRASYDYVVARAVARLNVLCELCLPLVKKNGYFYALKAAKSQEELNEAKGSMAILGGKFIEDKQIYLPNTDDQRHVLVIEKKKETPKKYPRKSGLPSKKPIN